jgi:Family of unknown function (DUF5689)
MKKVQILVSLCFVLIASIVASCVKTKVDVPADAAGIDPHLTVTHTLLQVKQMYNGVTPYTITDDVVVSGIVGGDDQSGNLYKSIVIQDSSTGMPILIEKSGLYNEFPKGRKVYIKCKGLVIQAYSKYIQLGYVVDNTGSLTGIPASLVNKFVVKATYPNAIPEKVVTISQLNVNDESLLGKVVTVKNAEFILADAGIPYAQMASIASATTRTLADCNGNKIAVRTSGYSNFGSANTPIGNGDFKAIFTRYGTTAQLVIIDTNDIKLTGTRCGGVVITPATDVTIDSLRHLFVGSDTNNQVTVNSLKIHGVVTSNLKDSNISKYNMILQDESGKGIVVYYGSNSYTYVMGDSLTIDLSNATLKYYRGTLEVTASTAKTSLISTGKSVTPKVVTIAEINADFANPNFGQRKYENSLVKVNNCTIAGTPTTYSGNKTITDGGASSMILYTGYAASFAGVSCPATAVSITAIASIYGKSWSANVNQLQIRKTSDVQ